MKRRVAGGVGVFHSLASSMQGWNMVHLMKSDVTHHIWTVGMRATKKPACLPQSASVRCSERVNARVKKETL